MMIKLDDWLYTKWDKHNLQEIMTARRARLKKSYELMPDVSGPWMSKGAYDESVRHSYAEENPLGVVGVFLPHLSWEGKLLFPWYPESEFTKPDFGKWPEWTDILGRKITNAPRLSMRPVLDLIEQGAPLSGIGLSSVTMDLSEPPETLPFGPGYYSLGNPLQGDYGD
jgi:hypothetical protein